MKVPPAMPGELFNNIFKLFFVSDTKNYWKTKSISGIIGVEEMIAMINRPDYINAITPFIDKPLVKILAGIRRCGKSTIFEMLRLELLKRGVSEGNII